MREISTHDIEALAIGAAILSTGGGGNPYIGKLRCLQLLLRGNRIKILDLDELADDAIVISVGAIGAPVISIEKFEQGEEGLRALRAVEECCGRKADALIAAEIGGANSMEPMITAAQAGLPVVDGDGMGRAFPEMQMVTFSIYGHSSVPAAMADEKGNVLLVRHALGDSWFERIARAAVVAMGGSAGSAMAPMEGRFVKRTAVPRTVSQAIDLGNIVLDAKMRHENPIDIICDREGGTRLMDAKIIDVKRLLLGGFSVGEIDLRGLGDYAGQKATVRIQNEFLAFARDGTTEVTVPDLVLVLDLDTGDAITTELLRYGQRVAIVGLPCHPLLRSPEALRVVGPEAFGLTGVEYHPLVHRASGLNRVLRRGSLGPDTP
jgi:DUF917 family protein